MKSYEEYKTESDARLEELKEQTKAVLDKNKRMYCQPLEPIEHICVNRGFMAVSDLIYRYTSNSIKPKDNQYTFVRATKVCDLDALHECRDEVLKSSWEMMLLLQIKEVLENSEDEEEANNKMNTLYQQSLGEPISQAENFCSEIYENFNRCYLAPIKKSPKILGCENVEMCFTYGRFRHFQKFGGELFSFSPEGKLSTNHQGGGGVSTNGGNSRQTADRLDLPPLSDRKGNEGYVSTSECSCSSDISTTVGRAPYEISHKYYDYTPYFEKARSLSITGIRQLEKMQHLAKVRTAQYRRGDVIGVAFDTEYVDYGVETPKDVVSYQFSFYKSGIFYELISFPTDISEECAKSDSYQYVNGSSIAINEIFTIISTILGYKSVTYDNSYYGLCNQYKKAEKEWKKWKSENPTLTRAQKSKKKYMVTKTMSLADLEEKRDRAKLGLGVREPKYVLISHFGIADWSSFNLPKARKGFLGEELSASLEKLKKEEGTYFDYKSVGVDNTGRYETDLMMHLDSISGGLVTEQDFTLCWKSALATDLTNSKLFPCSISVRDTMRHTASTSRSLDSLGDTLGLSKLDIPSDASKSDMRDCLNRYPNEYIDYAMRDSTLTLLYTYWVYGINTVVPMTMQGNICSIAKELILEYWHSCGYDYTEADFDYIYRGIKADLSADADYDWYKKEEKPQIFTPDVAVYMGMMADCYSGGFNEAILLGYFAEPTIDLDLKQAYPSVQYGIIDIDNTDPILSTCGGGEELTLDMFANARGDWDETKIFVGVIKFKYPHTVKFPNLKEKDVGNNIYCWEGSCEALSPEIYLALRQGAKITCSSGVWLRPKKSLTDNSYMRSLGYVAKQGILDRLVAKEKYGKGSPQEKLIKTLNNSLYGKTGQGGTGAKQWSESSDWKGTGEATEIPATKLTNLYYASMTTALVRCIVMACMTEAEMKGYHTYTVTTDGFVVAKDFPYWESDCMGFLEPYKTWQIAINGSYTGMWEVKHQNDTIINMRTRCNLASNEGGICAWTGYKSSKIIGLEEPKHSTKARNVLWDYAITKTAPDFAINGGSIGAFEYYYYNLCNYKNLRLVQKVQDYTDCSLGLSEEPKSRRCLEFGSYISKGTIRVDPDYKRKPEFLEYVEAPLSSGATHTIMNMSTRPYRDRYEYYAYRNYMERYHKTATNVIITKEDLDMIDAKIQLTDTTKHTPNKYIATEKNIEKTLEWCYYAISEGYFAKELEPMAFAMSSVNALCGFLVLALQYYGIEPNSKLQHYKDLRRRRNGRTAIDTIKVQGREVLEPVITDIEQNVLNLNGLEFEAVGRKFLAEEKAKASKLENERQKQQKAETKSKAEAEARSKQKENSHSVVTEHSQNANAPKGSPIKVSTSQIQKVQTTDDFDNFDDLNDYYDDDFYDD